MSHPGAIIQAYRGKAPRVHPSAFVAPGARLIGDVEIGPEASIWYNCVLRADIGRIVVGARSNVQDGAVMHVEAPREGHAGARFDTLIGEDALVGHMAVLHGCTIEDRGFAGMGAIVMDGARVCSDAMLSAGALLSPGKVVPTGEIWSGRPARLFRALRQEEIEGMAEGVAHYLELAEHHRALGQEDGGWTIS
jgi:carbonic anhydrase/acetyltransferase-like protein (isoleucine patch superfamily)